MGVPVITESGSRSMRSRWHRSVGASLMDVDRWRSIVCYSIIRQDGWLITASLCKL